MYLPRKRIGYVVSVFILLTVTGQWQMKRVFAAQQAKIQIAIKATVVIPPCEINGGQAIDVAFGEVDISDVNYDRNNGGRSVVKTVQVSCPPGVTDSNALKIKVSGTTSEATNRLLTSGGSGAGIGLYQGNVLTNLKPLTIGSLLSLNEVGSITGSYESGYNGEFTFSARVEKANSSTSVVPGEFAATATLIIEQL